LRSRALAGVGTADAQSASPRSDKPAFSAGYRPGLRRPAAGVFAAYLSRSDAKVLPA